MKAVILAAGMGSRLGDSDLPKPLTPLCNGHSILSFQLENIARFLNLDQVYIVVGFHKEKIIEKFPAVHFVHNSDYFKENTSKSLLKGLQNIEDDVIWLNGDVVFHPAVFQNLLEFNQTAMVVNEGPVGEEEVKYMANPQGQILEVSKQVSKPMGEALGINLVNSADLPLLKEELEKCAASDYFEKGVETGIKRGMRFFALPVDSNSCTEVDFPEDLARANQMIQSWQK